MTERRLPPTGISGTAGLTPAEAAPFLDAGEILRADPRVRAAWGFGSRARGVASVRSDVDIAVWLGEKPSLMEKLRLHADLVEGLGRDDIDLVVMDEAPPLLCYEAVSAGYRFLSRDDEAADDFELRCLREYLDTQYLRDVQRRLAREAVRDL